MWLGSLSVNDISKSCNGDCFSIFPLSNVVKQGGVLSSIIFTFELDGLTDERRNKGLSCHFNDHFVGCFIYYADPISSITLLAPSREALLGGSSEYGDMHIILFNASNNKIECILYTDETHTTLTLFDKHVQFMWSHIYIYIRFVDKCKCLGFSISRDI